MAFFRNSTTWVIDYRYEGRSRRWVKVFPAGLEPTSLVCEELRALHGDRATLVQVRVATAEEESQFLRGVGPRNVLCPTGRSAVGGNG